MESTIAKLLDVIKVTLVVKLSQLLAYFEPIYAPITVLGIAFFWDIIAGLVVDLVVNKDRLRFKKILFALLAFAIYTTILSNVYVITEKQGDMSEGLSIIKTLTYVLTYFYGANIIRNLRLLLPRNKFIAFLDFFIGLHVIKYLPVLADFLGMGSKKQKKEEDHETEA